MSLHVCGLGANVDWTVQESMKGSNGGRQGHDVCLVLLEHKPIPARTKLYRLLYASATVMYGRGIPP